MTTGPLLSIVTPVFDPPVDVLAETIDSVLAQTFEDWEWVLVDDCSTDPAVPALIEERAGQDARIRLVRRETNGHIVAASNDAVDAARGEFLVLLDHDDLLRPAALATVARVLAEHDDVDFVYSDEDKTDEDGRRYDRFAKPTWSPERLRGQMYTSHLTAYRASVVRDLGGFRTGFEGSQDHDLALRVGEVARRVVHIPEVLYHWRAVAGSAAAAPEAKPYATLAGARAVQEHLDRIGQPARVEQGREPGRYVIQRELDPGLRVSVIIPTIGTSDIVFGSTRVLVVEAVRSLLAKTDHPNLEIVVVHDEPTPDSVLQELREVAGDALVLVPFDKPFNFSEKMNVGVIRSTGERVVFLNDDVEVISERWLENLVGPLAEPDVGMTGAKLYFSDGTIQHAGHGYWSGHYHHPYRFWTSEESGPFGELVVNREVSGVTAACAAMRRETFLLCGGFAEGFPSNFNDVDLCMKVTSQGMRIVWVANCELYHFESRSRDSRVASWERISIVERWGLPTRDDYTPDPAAIPLDDPRLILEGDIATSDVNFPLRRRNHVAQIAAHAAARRNREPVDVDLVVEAIEDLHEGQD